MTLHNANRHTTIHGPAITVPPLRATLYNSRVSCRDAMLSAIDRLRQQTGATEFARQSIYRCLRCMAGLEPGSAYRDLDDLGNRGLRLRS